MNRQLKHGDMVLVVNTMNYNGRRGVLKPISDDPEDCWEFTVDLFEGIQGDRLSKVKKIGVSSFQVVPLSLQGLRPAMKRQTLESLSEEGLGNVIAGCVMKLRDLPINSEKFMAVKMIIQDTLEAMVTYKPEMNDIFVQWRKLGGSEGTLFAYTDAIANLYKILDKTGNSIA